MKLPVEQVLIAMQLLSHVDPLPSPANFRQQIVFFHHMQNGFGVAMYAFGFQRKTHPAISVCVEAFFLLLADRGRQFRILFRLSYPADKIIVPAS